MKNQIKFMTSSVPEHSKINLCRGYIHVTARAMWIVPVYSTLLWEGVLRFKMFIYEEISMPQTRVDQYEY